MRLESVRTQIEELDQGIDRNDDEIDALRLKHERNAERINERTSVEVLIEDKQRLFEQLRNEVDEKTEERQFLRIRIEQLRNGQLWLAPYSVEQLHTSVRSISHQLSYRVKRMRVMQTEMQVLRRQHREAYARIEQRQNLIRTQLRIEKRIKRLEEQKQGSYEQMKILRKERSDLENIVRRPPIASRIIRFPADHSLGALYVRDIGHVSGYPSEFYGDARGEVSVPAGKELLLKLTHPGDGLQNIVEGDLQWLYVTDHTAEFRIAPYVKHLQSIQIIHGTNRDWMDHWLTLKKD